MGQGLFLSGASFALGTLVIGLGDRGASGEALYSHYWLGVMSAAGALSIAGALPALGRVFDEATIAAAGDQDAFEALQVRRDLVLGSPEGHEGRRGRLLSE